MAGVGIAAGVAAAAAVASAGVGVASAVGGMGGGGSPGPTQFQKVPQDPLTKAQRSYWNRVQLENADKTYPSFSAYSQSGGDPTKAQFPLTMPGMTPQEMTAFGLTGPQGQPVPTSPYSTALTQGQLTPEQEIFLGKQRSREAQQAGGPGNATPLQQLGQVSTRLENVQSRLTGADPSQQALIDRLTNKQTRLQNRQSMLQQKVGNM